MNAELKFRHELKYQCSEAQLEIIRNRIKNFLQYDSHAKDGQYCIRSMYFDNYENRCYYENESGTDPREKYRIRIYNSSDSRISLECKRKENGKTHKTSCLLTKSQFQSIMAGRLADYEINSALLRKFSYLMMTELYKPAVIVEYDRTPYVYHDGNVRITLDRNIRSSNEYAKFFQSNLATREIMPKGQHLLEVKFDEFIPDFILDILQIEDLQRSTFSKYYLCRKYSNGGIL